MAFLKKHIVWLVLGLVLVAEAVFLVLLLGKEGEAAAKKKNLETKKGERDGLSKQNPGDPAILAVLGQRKRDIARERGEAIEFLWGLARALAPLFPDVKEGADAKEPKAIALAERDFVRPWQEPTARGVFTDSFQRLYDAYADRLAPTLKKIGSDRRLAGLAALSGFTARTDLGMGDFYLEQKRFWIIQAIAEAGDKANLHSLEIGTIAHPLPSSPSELKKLAEDARLTETYDFKITAACRYPDLAVFMAELLRSAICFRIENIDDFHVTEPVDIARQRKEAAETKGGPSPEGETPSTKESGPAASQAEYLTKVVFDCKAVDFNIVVRQVRFTGPRFQAVAGKDPKAALKAKVRAWIDEEIARLDKELKDKKGAQRWADACQKTIADALPKAPAEKDKEKAKAIAIILSDRITYLQDEVANLLKKGDARKTKEDWGILYDFGQDAATAQRWVTHYPAFEALALAARKALLGTLRQAVDADKGEAKDGLILTFYPEKTPEGKLILDPKQTFEHALDPDGAVQIEYGLMLFRAKENSIPVIRAGK